jgi:hypothetical protein
MARVENQKNTYLHLGTCAIFSAGKAVLREDNSFSISPFHGVLYNFQDMVGLLIN